MGFELRRFGFVAVTALLAFKAALVFQQLALYLAMRGLGRTNTTFELGFGLGGTEARGIESCTSAAATAAAAVGVFAGLLVAIPILLLYVTGRTPARRFPAAFVYLFALGGVAEVLRRRPPRPPRVARDVVQESGLVQAHGRRRNHLARTRHRLSRSPSRCRKSATTWVDRS